MWEQASRWITMMLVPAHTALHDLAPGVILHPRILTSTELSLELYPEGVRDPVSCNDAIVDRLLSPVRVRWWKILSSQVRRQPESLHSLCAALCTGQSLPLLRGLHGHSSHIAEQASAMDFTARRPILHIFVAAVCMS